MALWMRLHSSFTREVSAILLNVYANQDTGGELSIVFDATHSSRVAQKTQIDQKGAYEIFGLPISFRIQAGRYKAQTVSNLVITILHFL